MRPFAGGSSRRERGAALLAAMLTVTLVATFAAAALWQQWRSVEIEAAERARVQSGWILTGALDWSRLILRADAIGGVTIDHLGEPWAVPLEESRLSTFLAADRDNTGGQTDEDALDAFLSGRIVDLQSRLNLRTLVISSAEEDPHLESFKRLFDLLSLPAAELNALVANLRRNSAVELASENEAADAPLWPQRVEQLVAYGLSPPTLATIEPYVTLLPGPEPTPLNLNTASAVVLAASEPRLSLADAERIVAARAQRHFVNPTQASQVLGPKEPLFQGERFNVSSTHFEVRGRLRLDSITLEERSVVKRIGSGSGTKVETISRERTVFDDRALLSAAASAPGSQLARQPP